MKKPRKPILHKAKETFKLSKRDFSKENVIEGAIIRPAILTLSFVSFLVGVLFFLNAIQTSQADAYKWGGSFILFSFVLTLQSIYSSLKDEPSKFRNYNLGFKSVLLVFEISIFHSLLTLII